MNEHSFGDGKGCLMAPASALPLLRRLPSQWSPSLGVSSSGPPRVGQFAKVQAGGNWIELPISYNHESRAEALAVQQSAWPPSRR